MRRSCVYSHLSRPEGPVTCFLPRRLNRGCSSDVSGELVKLGTNVQSQEPKYGVGEATPHPDGASLAGIRHHEHVIHLLPREVANVRHDTLDGILVVSEDDIEQPFRGVVPVAEDDLFATEARGLHEIRQADPAVAFLLVIGTHVRDSVERHGLTELALVNLLCADKMPATDRNGVHLTRDILALKRGDVAEWLVAAVQDMANPVFVSVRKLVELFVLHTNEPGPNGRSFHDPLAVRNDMGRLDLCDVLFGVPPPLVGVEVLSGAFADIPVVVDIRPSLGGVRHLNHLLCNIRIDSIRKATATLQEFAVLYGEENTPNRALSTPYTYADYKVLRK